MTLYATLVMFLWPVVRVAHNVPSSGKISCGSINCDRERVSSDNCPPWHACNMHSGLCRPCNRCNPKDADDEARYRSTSLPNCQYPTECLTSFDPHPNDMCPFLKVNEDYQCSGNCLPCQGTFGHFLGTVCRLSCADGDSEVFACTFVNERAQWNTTRKPRWTDYERYPLTTSRLQLHEDSSSNQPTYPIGFTQVTALPREALPSTSTPELATTDIIIVAVAMVVVVVVAVFGFAVIWRRRRRVPRQPLTPTSSSPSPSPPALSPPMQPNDEDEEEEAQEERCPLVDPETRPKPVAVVHDERAMEETSAVCSSNTNHHRPVPTENLDSTPSIQETQQEDQSSADQQQEQKIVDSARHVVCYGNGTRIPGEYPDTSGPSTNIVSLHSAYSLLDVNEL